MKICIYFFEIAKKYSNIPEAFKLKIHNNNKIGQLRDI